MTNHFAGIDLSFRPATMLFPLLLSRVKGTARRQELIRAMEEERLEDLPPYFLQSALSHEERSASSALHPALMGGEYLPDFLKGEVEVARIELASTTGDVISIRMRPTKKGLVYRVVDEYMTTFTSDDEDEADADSDNDGDDDAQRELDGASRADDCDTHEEGDFSIADSESHVDSTPLVSQVPLSLAEIGEFVVEAAKVEDMALMHDFYSVEEALNFISGSSVYYPEFGAYLAAFIQSVMPEDDENDDDEDDDEGEDDDEDDNEGEGEGEDDSDGYDDDDLDGESED